MPVQMSSLFVFNIIISLKNHCTFAYLAISENGQGATRARQQNQSTVYLLLEVTISFLSLQLQSSSFAV